MPETSISRGAFAFAEKKDDGRFCGRILNMILNIVVSEGNY